MAFDREIVALTIFCEASSSTPEERRAIAHVIKNRVGRFGSTQAEVCLRRYQFSEWNDDKVNNANLLRGAKRDESDPIIQDCLAAYRQVILGLPDMTKGATHYHDKTIPPPYWTKDATMTLETRDFFFYKDVK